MNFFSDSVDWRKLRLRPNDRELLCKVSSARYDPSIRFIVLFGSVAREEARLTSDVDIAVISDESLANSVRWGLDTDWPQDCDYRLTFIHTADLSDGSSMRVGSSILREGVVLYERN